MYSPLHYERICKYAHMLKKIYIKSANDEKVFPHRDSNPGLLGESQLS